MTIESFQNRITQRLRSSQSDSLDSFQNKIRERLLQGTERFEREQERIASIPQPGDIKGFAIPEPVSPSVRSFTSRDKAITESLGRIRHQLDITTQAEPIGTRVPQDIPLPQFPREVPIPPQEEDQPDLGLREEEDVSIFDERRIGKAIIGTLNNIDDFISEPLLPEKAEATRASFLNKLLGKEDFKRLKEALQRKKFKSSDVKSLISNQGFIREILLDVIPEVDIPTEEELQVRPELELAAILKILGREVGTELTDFVFGFATRPDQLFGVLPVMNVALRYIGLAGKAGFKWFKNMFNKAGIKPTDSVQVAREKILNVVSESISKKQSSPFKIEVKKQLTNFGKEQATAAAAVLKAGTVQTRTPGAAQPPASTQADREGLVFATIDLIKRGQIADKDIAEVKGIIQEIIDEEAAGIGDEIAVALKEEVEAGNKSAIKVTNKFLPGKGKKPPVVGGAKQPPKDVVKKQVVKDAIKLFGITKNPKDTGFVLEDGKMLDLKRGTALEGRQHGGVGDLGNIKGDTTQARIANFQLITNAVRLNPQQGFVGISITAGQKVSQSQWQQIAKVIKESNTGVGAIGFDILEAKTGRPLVATSVTTIGEVRQMFDAFQKNPAQFGGAPAEFTGLEFFKKVSGQAKPIVPIMEGYFNKIGDVPFLRDVGSVLDDIDTFLSARTQELAGAQGKTRKVIEVIEQSGFNFLDESVKKFNMTNQEKAAFMRALDTHQQFFIDKINRDDFRFERIFEGEVVSATGKKSPTLNAVRNWIKEQLGENVINPIPQRILKRKKIITTKKIKPVTKPISKQQLIDNPGMFREILANPKLHSAKVVTFAKRLKSEGGFADFTQKKAERGRRKDRSHKAGVTPEQEAALRSWVKALKLDITETETLGAWIDAATQMGLDLPQLLKATSNPKNILSKEQVIALGDAVNTAIAKHQQARQEWQAIRGKNPVKEAKLEQRMEEWETVLKTALSNQINGLTEVARALRAAQIIAKANNMQPDFWIRKAARVIGKKITTAKFSDIIDTIHDISQNGTPLEMAEFIKGLEVSSNVEKLIALWKAGLLTSFRTHTANIFGTATMSALETVVDVPATGIDILVSLSRQALGKGAFRTVTISPRTIAAKIKAIPKAVQTAGRFFKTGIYSDDLLSKYDLPKTVKFDKLTYLNTYMNWVFRSLGAEDIFFREIAMMESLEKNAIVIAKNEVSQGILDKTKQKERIRELLIEPTPVMQKTAIDTAARVTFQNPNTVSEMVSRAKSVSKKKAGQFESESKRFKAEMFAAGIDVIAPFVRTPTNIALRILDLSPVGFAKAVIRLGRASIRTSLIEEEQLQKKIVEDIARGITGTTIIAIGAYLASIGLMVGNAPEKQADRDHFFLEGKKPNSILLGGFWRSLNRISPFGNLLVIGAELYNNWAEGRGVLSTSGQTTLDAAKMISEQTFLQGVSGGLKALNDPDRFGDAYVNRMMGSMIPSFFSTTARVFDPFQRVPSNGIIGIVEAFAARTPILSKTVALRMDAFGNPVKYPSGDSANFYKRAAAVFLDPFPSSRAFKNPVLAEANKIGFKINIPSKTISNIRLNNKEWEVFQHLQGQALETALMFTMHTPQYVDADTAGKVEMFERIDREVSSAHNDTMFPLIMIKRYDLSRDFEPEVYFPAIRDAASAVGNQARFKNTSRQNQRKILVNAIRQKGINHPL